MFTSNSDHNLLCARMNVKWKKKSMGPIKELFNIEICEKCYTTNEEVKKYPFPIN